MTDRRTSVSPEQLAAIREALDVLRADAIDPHRDSAWRYGVRHTLTVVERALAAAPASPQPGLDVIEGLLVDWLETTNIMEEASLDGADVAIFEHVLANHGLAVLRLLPTDTEAPK